MRLSSIFVLLVGFQSYAQYIHEDVSKYIVRLSVSDSSSSISVHETINLLRYDYRDSIYLDLNHNMLISKCLVDGAQMDFIHRADVVIIPPPSSNKLNVSMDIWYAGTPSDGLIISKNKYGDRTFFGDNWPNRARNWIACHDHPADKALFSFLVDAPNTYKVVAVGAFTESRDLGNGLMRWEYNSSVPLPTKVAVIGIAKMIWKNVAVVDGVAVTSAVYPQNSSKSFHDLEFAPVQSTTRYGGMENAGCIFYDENALTGKQKSEALIAHELAHQWFGNSVTEKSWEHIWLSEGFATYLTNIYLLKKYGEKRFKEQMQMDREQVLAFYKKYKNPLVDTKCGDPNRLLNPNSYQKGSWVLHMLRCQLGDSLFQKGLRDFYQSFRLGNADSEDFKNSMEISTGLELGGFFENWLHKEGHPILKTVLDQTDGKRTLIIRQVQDAIFQFSLKVQFDLGNGKFHTQLFQINEQEERIELPDVGSKISAYKLDPDVELLFEEIY
jgi:aminopeptidase N